MRFLLRRNDKFAESWNVKKDIGNAVEDLPALIYTKHIKLDSAVLQSVPLNERNFVFQKHLNAKIFKNKKINL